MKQNKILVKLMAIFLATIMCIVITPTVSADETDELVAYWNFEEGDGSTVYDQTTNDNDGTLYGATFSTTAKVGDYSVHFDGIDDYISVPTSDSLEGITTQVTVETWVRLDAVINARYVRTPYESGGLSFGIDRWSNKLRFFIYDGGTPSSWHICEKSWNPSIDTWYHICGTYDGATLKLYLDGNLYHSLSYVGDIDPNSLGVVMGARLSDGGDDFHKGYLDEVRIYNYALSYDVVSEHASCNYNPPVANANGPYLVALDQTITLDGSGSSDLDGDSLLYSWSQAETLGTIDNPDTESPEFTASVTGITDLTLTVDDGYFEHSDTTIIVVYDPDGGFVTGGGWIDSPEGAYYPDETLTGKANFGFVSKYKKGVPIGNTEFHFKVADFNFHSDSYEWLVVTNHKAMYKGTGTVNGEGDYGFMISVIDADKTPSTDVDLFRIKIWNKDDDTLVYDNMLDVPEDEDPTTTISGGQIKIHKN